MTTPARYARECEIEGRKDERKALQEQSESVRGEERKRSGLIVGASETSEKLAKWRRLRQKRLNILGMLNRKGWS